MASGHSCDPVSAWIGSERRLSQTYNATVGGLAGVWDTVFTGLSELVKEKDPGVIIRVVPGGGLIAVQKDCHLRTVAGNGRFLTHGLMPSRNRHFLRAKEPTVPRLGFMGQANFNLYFCDKLFRIRCKPSV